jgi:5-(carboxyamino)imidazole ribonucleotide synthase
VRVGVVGGGQLGRMLGFAGVRLGHTFTFLDPSELAGAKAAGDLIVASYDDEDALAELAARSDVITFEFENVSSSALQAIDVDVLPPVNALEATQDRASEKELFARCGIDAASYALASTPDELRKAIEQVGIPCVVKTRREGYDGKGQAVVRSETDVTTAIARMGGSSAIVESFVEFERELSIVSVRSNDGEVKAYPLVENVHHEGILRLSRAPAPDAEGLQAAAEGIVRRLLDELGYVGVLTLEMFQRGGDLLANEIAPRVHNSGHWTIEGAETSQFENHIRAVTGADLGPTSAVGFSAMVNLIGAIPDPSEVLGIPGAHLHLYDKEPRPGRKVGHITITADDPDEVDRGLEAARGLAGTHLGPAS